MPYLMKSMVTFYYYIDNMYIFGFFFLLVISLLTYVFIFIHLFS